MTGAKDDRPVWDRIGDYLGRMKNALFAALGIVIGFVLGGIGPRMDLAELQAALDETRAALDDVEQQTRRNPALPVPGMSDMFAPDPEGSDPDGMDPEDDEGIDAADEADEMMLDADVDPDAGGARTALADDFDIAVDAQRMRAAQSRAALQEQADLSDADMTEFDDIVDDMNIALSDYGDALLDIALSGEEPEPEQMLILTHEVTGILYDSQTAVNDLIGTEGMDEADPTVRQVWNHIDLGVFRDSIEGMQE